MTMRRNPPMAVSEDTRGCSASPSLASARAAA
jgi:hypothetical protein